MQSSFVGSENYYNVYALRMNFNMPPLQTNAAKTTEADQTFFNREVNTQTELSLTVCDSSFAASSLIDKSINYGESYGNMNNAGMTL